MPKSRIGYNIHAMGVHDRDYLRRHLKALDPASVLVMDGLTLAREIKHDLPECIVIHRNYMGVGGDDGVHTRFSPEVWLSKHHDEIEAGLWIYCNNEPEWSAAAIDWFTRLIPLAVERRAKLVLGNWSVGNPQPDDWQRARALLELLDLHRETIILGLHEYGCGVMTSGLVGGHPEDELYHPNFVKPENWPAGAQGLTLWHCGRFKFLNDKCREMGIKPPRIIITEHGLDDVSDVKAWANTLRRTGEYTDIRGWKTLVEQWKVWWPQWDAERAYYQQLDWADRAIYDYDGTNVEAQLVYCWGHIDPRWEPFDVGGAGALQTLLAQRVAKPIVISTEVPAERGEGVAITVRIAQGFTDLTRQTAEPRMKISDVFSGETVILYPATRRVIGKQTWYYVERQKTTLPDLQRRGWMVYDFAPERPAPVDPVPAEKPYLTVFPRDSAGKLRTLFALRAALEKQIAAVDDSIADLWKVIEETA